MPKRGLFGSPVSAPAQSRDQFDSEIDDLLGKLKKVTLVRALSSGNGIGEVEVPAPQPNTVGELANGFTAAASMHKEAAATALRRAESAEQAAASAREVGEAEADQRWAALQGFRSEIAGKLDALTEKAHQGELSAKDAEHRADLARLEGKLDAAIAAKDREIAAVAQRAETAEGRAAALREELGRRKSYAEIVGEVFMGGDLPPELAPIRRILAPAAPAVQSAQERLEHEMVPVLVDRARTEISATNADQARRDVAHQVWADVGRGVGGLVGDLRGVVRTVLPGIFQAAAGGARPNSEVPDDFDEVEPFEQAADGQQ